jgi:RimJ/RimL family protein N-acetyltransferase
MRWLGGVQTRRELKSDVNYFMKSETAEGLTFWAVERKADEAILGFCGLLRIREADCPACGEMEIGWRIREDDWRRGYAFEVATAVLDYAFGQRAIQLVVSRAAAGNTASRELMRKLGMRHTTSLDYIPDGEDVALVTYVIERRWAKIPGSRTEAGD